MQLHKLDSTCQHRFEKWRDRLVCIVYQEPGSKQDGGTLMTAVAERYIGLLTAVTKTDAPAHAANDAQGAISSAKQDKLVQAVSALQEGLCERDVEVPIKVYSLLHERSDSALMALRLHTLHC